MSTSNDRERGLLQMIGLCRGAGRAVIGVPLICEALKKRASRSGISEGEASNNIMVIEASDTSDNTHKRISDRCAYYNVRHIKIESDQVALGKAVGKGAVGAIMINDEGFCRAIDKKLAR